MAAEDLLESKTRTNSGYKTLKQNPNPNEKKFIIREAMTSQTSVFVVKTGLFLLLNEMSSPVRRCLVMLLSTSVIGISSGSSGLFLLNIVAGFVTL
jgi:hypothetical protein